MIATSLVRISNPIWLVINKISENTLLNLQAFIANICLKLAI